VTSKEFKQWMAQVAPSGRIPDSAKGLHSPPVEFNNVLRSLRAQGAKDLVTGSSDTSAGAFVETDYRGIYEPLGRYALNILNLISRRETTSDLVEFVRQTTRVQEASPTQEANVTDSDSTATGAVIGEKPEGDVAFEKVQAAVKTIPVWIPATKRALSDAAQIRGIIDQELEDDLMEELEYQIVNGNGVGENFTGIFNTAGVLEQAWVTDILTTARNAITYLQVTGRAIPTAWVLHPEDWETIELTTDDNNRYYYAGPQQRGPQTLWGVPVVTSQSLTQGTGLLGDFRKAILWDRQQTTISVSDSHEDFFIRNMVAILAEMRAAFGLIRPSAFVEVDLEAGS
jgi:HK97 family phage major capsid protein